MTATATTLPTRHERVAASAGRRAPAVQEQCQRWPLPTVAGQCGRLAEQAARERQPSLGSLEALLAAAREERERNAIARRLQEAHLPRIKTLEEFDFTQTPPLSPTRRAALAEGGYIARAEPVVFVGECGTGKTHLMSGWCVAACRPRRRVRCTTAAALVTELVEAKQQGQLQRALARWLRDEVLALDEGGDVPLAELGGECLFQVISERAARVAVLLTTNLPCSEWTQVLPNARRCTALLDRITDRAHLIETGTESFRFRRTLAQRAQRQRGPRSGGPDAD